MRARRTLLFAPGNRTEVHAKALGAGADVVCLDLEDAVPPNLKAEARAAVLGFLDGVAGPERAIRINSPRTIEGLRDLLAIIEVRPAAGTLFLPKVETAEEVRFVAGLLAEAGLDLGVAVLIESAEGLENVASILSASPRIAFAMFGGADLSAELGVALAHEPLLYARSRVVHAARRAGVDLFDVPCLAFRDAATVEHESLRARSLGFTGKGVLHPTNVAVVNAAFAPTQDEIVHAERVLAAYDASPTGLATLDGKLVERPVVRAMERVLALRDVISS